MSQTERLYRLKSLLDAGRCLTRQFLVEEFGTSPATVKRDIAHLRDRMNAPVVFDRERGGWRFDRQAATIGTQYELPGLWLTAEEIHALLTMQHLLAHLDAGGLLGPRIAPLVERLDKLLGVGSNASAEVVRRIRVQTVGAQGPLPHFQAVGTCQKAGGMTRFATGTWQAGSIYRRRESLGGSSSDVGPLPIERIRVRGRAGHRAFACAIRPPRSQPPRRRGCSRAQLRRTRRVIR